MKKFQPTICNIPVTIEKLVPGGQGIGTIKESFDSFPNLQGKKGFFWNALPGETVTEFEITKKKSHYFEAIALKVDSPSKHRTEPKDSCFLSTSPWQIMDLEYELNQKTEILKEIFRQNSLTENVIPQELLETLTVKTDGKDFYYRNKMEYSLWYEKSDEKIHLAFHRRGSHSKIPIESSSIERPEIFARAKQIVDELNQNGEEARKYQSMMLRANQKGEVSGGLFENGKPHPVFEKLEDQVQGHVYSYSPNGFFQINLPLYEMALNEMKKHIDSENVLDLYSGVGTIGLSIARDKNLTLVEVDKSAYLELEKNAKEIAASIKTVLAKSEDVTEYIKHDQTVILDPPRAGIDKKLTEKLIEVTPSTIIYLSCNPVTQARDVQLLSEKYHVTHVQPFNFFPRTPHLENLIVLKRS